VPDYELRAWDLLTEEDAKRYLGIATDVESDLLRLLIISVTDRVEDHLARQVVPRAKTEYLDGDGRVDIGLGNYPVDTLTSVEFLNDDGTVGTTVDVTDGTGDLWLRKEIGVLVMKPGQSTFPKGVRNVKVIYSPGFNPVPNSITAAAMFILAKWWRDQENKRGDDILSISIEGQTFSYSQDPLPSKAKGALEPFRVFGLGGA
jgi:hypothetical protein